MNLGPPFFDASTTYAGKAIQLMIVGLTEGHRRQHYPR